MPFGVSSGETSASLAATVATLCDSMKMKHQTADIGHLWDAPTRAANRILAASVNFERPPITRRFFFAALHALRVSD